eukprot:gene25128-30346_t
MNSTQSSERQYIPSSSSASDNEEDDPFSRVPSPTTFVPESLTEQKDHRAADEYIRNCQHFQLKVDPSVVIALQTGWDVLQPTRYFAEGSMLPLTDILTSNNAIKRLNFANVGMQDARFRCAGNGNSNARVLNYILQRNQWIEELDLTNNGLDDDGIREISTGLTKNSSVKRLSLSRNHFGEIGATYLAQALQQNSTLKYLDLSRNALGFRSISTLRCVCEPKGVAIETNGNYVFEEILNSVSHGIAFLGSVVGANVLISDAADTYRTDYHFWACVLYSFALMFLFLSSCLFHSFFMLPTTSRILQILDHVGIYLVIAGSYTPFLLIALHHYTSARVLLTAQWIMAFLGSTFATCSDLNAPSTTLIELIIFVSMGSGILLVLPEVLAELCREAIVLATLGLMFYGVGIIFFILGEYKPIYHTIWHLFVVAAAAVHWFCIYFFVVQVQITSPTKTALSDAAYAMDNMMTAAINQTRMMTGEFSD